MDDITPANASNDRAFIKVAMELRQLENAVQVGETMQKMQKRFSSAESSHRQNYGSGDGPKTMAKNCLATDNCPEPYKSYMVFLENFQDDFAHIGPQLEKFRARIAELKKLFDLYSEGKDIVMEKLSLQREDEQ